MLCRSRISSHLGSRQRSILQSDPVGRDRLIAAYLSVVLRFSSRGRMVVRIRGLTWDTGEDFEYILETKF